jgi:alpha-beta hydrolase superfamily lysophospholipase
MKHLGLRSAALVRTVLAALALTAAPALAGDVDPFSIRFWQGSISPPEDTAAGPAAAPGAAKPKPLFVRLEVLPPTAEVPPRIFVTAPAAGAVRKEARDVRVSDRTISFTFDARGVAGRFRGDVNPVGTAYEGKLTLSAPGQPASELAFALAPSVDPAALAGATRWNGTLEAGGQRLGMSLLVADASTGPVGSIDIPVQGLAGFPALVERAADGTLTVTIPVGVDAVMTLAPAADGARLEGRFAQGGFEGPLVLEKGEAAEAMALKRPQTPEPPFPYSTREVTIPHRFGHSLAGTLVVPAADPANAERKVPAVVFVTGSGPQDRDETIAGHKPFAVIADALARAGIASLRYDDRGIGSSTGSFGPASTFDLATDADEASEWLKRQPGIDAARVGILGHSEGAIIAPLVSRWQREEAEPKDPVAFLVLIAPPALPGTDVLKRQMRQILEASELPPESVDEIVAAQAALLDGMAAKIPVEQRVERARALIAAQAKAERGRTGRELTPSETDEAVRAALAELSGPWMKVFLEYDPRTALAVTTVPVLAVWGSLDTQVDPALNAPELEKAVRAAGGTPAVRIFPGLNHLLQPAKTGSPEEYAEIETTVDPAALAAIVDWVKATAAAPAP